MADFRARQRVQLHDGTDEFAVTSAKPIFVHLSDGTETANVNASNQLEVAVLTMNDGGNSITIDGTLTGITNDVNIADGGNSITVDGTVAATQSGAWDIGTVTTLTGITNDVNIADGGNSITVDATQLDVDDLNKDDDEVLVWANTAKDGTGTDYVPLVDADGHLQVDILSGGGSNASVHVDDAAFTVATDSVTAIGGIATADSVDAGDVGALRMLTNRALVTTLEDANGDGIAIDAAGNVAAILSANDGVDIGDVDVASVPAPLNVVGGGVEATALRVTIANDSTGLLSVDDNGSSLTVDANQLDIDDLAHGTDSVAIGDGVETLNITAAGEAEVDIAAQSLTALKVSKDANANSETNPIYVQMVTTTTSANEVNDYDTAAAVAKDASDTHTYTAINTFLLKSVIVASSGAMKSEIKAGAAAAETTRAVVFTSGAKPTEQVFFDPPIEITTGQNILVVRRNDDNQAMDVYSTIIGSDV